MQIVLIEMGKYLPDQPDAEPGLVPQTPESRAPVYLLKPIEIAHGRQHQAVMAPVSGTLDGQSRQSGYNQQRDCDSSKNEALMSRTFAIQRRQDSVFEEAASALENRRPVCCDKGDLGYGQYKGPVAPKCLLADG